MGGKSDVVLIKNGKRLDGRALDELRPINAEVGVLNRAQGSARFSFGSTTAIAGVYGPQKVYPKRMEEAERAILRTDYRMAPFSTTERSRPGPSRRSTEISFVTRNAILPVIITEEFPKTSIDAVIEILQADASTRCCGINAAVMALADAGIPMRDLVASCSAGKINGTTVLDVAGEEDMSGEVDMPVAYYPKRKEVTLLQLDGIITPEEAKEVLKLAVKGCEQVYKKMQDALRSKYLGEESDRN